MPFIKSPYNKITIVDPDTREEIWLEFTGELRSPKLGEYFLMSSSTDSKAEPAKVCNTDASKQFKEVRLILKPVWSWPKWLKARYIFRGPDSGLWWASDTKPEPVVAPGQSYWETGKDTRKACLFPELFNLDPPCDKNVPWTETLRVNPAYEPLDSSKEPTSSTLRLIRDAQEL